MYSRRDFLAMTSASLLLGGSGLAGAQTAGNNQTSHITL